MSDGRKPFAIRFDPDMRGVRINPAQFPPTREGVAEWVRAMRAVVEQLGGKVDPAAPLLAVDAPCGRRYEFDTEAEVPVFDLPCGCGGPDCWVLRWEDPDGE